MFTVPLHATYLEAMGYSAIGTLVQALQSNPEALQEVNRLASEGNTGCVDYVTVPEFDLITSALEQSSADADSENIPDWVSATERDSETYTWDVDTGEIAGFTSPLDRSAEIRILFDNDVIVVIETE